MNPEAIELAVLKEVINFVLTYSGVLIAVFLAFLGVMAYGIYRVLL